MTCRCMHIFGQFLLHAAIEKNEDIQVMLHSLCAPKAGFAKHGSLQCTKTDSFGFRDPNLHTSSGAQYYMANMTMNPYLKLTETSQV